MVAPLVGLALMNHAAEVAPSRELNLSVWLLAQAQQQIRQFWAPIPKLGQQYRR